jgi:23S rRNA (adenine2503-C2)-methyltransferase
MMNSISIEQGKIAPQKQIYLSDQTMIKGMTFTELQEWCIDKGESAYRGGQLFEWLYRHGKTNIDEMSNIKKSFRDFLTRNAILETLTLEGISDSTQESTQKFLFKTHDSKFIESVSIIEKDRHTVCLSTQIGCNVDCDFCATGKMGFSRNLLTGEIVDQLLWVMRKTALPVTNIVFMGMGEPFLNYNRVMDAADIFHHQKGFDLASTRITISTAGIIPRIYQFITENRKFKLAISLNASDDITRTQIMPLNSKWSIKELIKAGKTYSELPRRRVMFEYVLLKNINDSIEDAVRLHKLLNGVQCKLNLIPYNSVGGKFNRPDEDKIKKFAEYLYDRQTTYRVLVRWSKGKDINAACGQLAVNNKEKEDL